jgi:hypothetical protein
LTVKRELELILSPIQNATSLRHSRTAFDVVMGSGLD